MDYKELNERLINSMLTLIDFQSSNKSYDNLFSANHRNNMITKHGYSESQHVTIEDLQNANR